MRLSRRWQKRVNAWADKNGLGPGSNSAMLFSEMTEQVGELYEAVADDDRKEIAKRVGRIATLSCIIAHQNRIKFDGVQKDAWNDLKDRAAFVRGQRDVFPQGKRRTRGP